MVVLLHVHCVVHLMHSGSQSNFKHLNTERKLASNFSEFKTEKKNSKDFTRWTNFCRPLFLAAYVKKMVKKPLVD